MQILTVILIHALPAFTLIHGLSLPVGPAFSLIVAAFTIQVPLLVFGRDVAFLKDGAGARLVYRLSMLSFVLILDLFLASLVHLLVRGILTAAGWDVSGSLTVYPVFGAAILHVFWGIVNARRLAVRRVVFDPEDFPASWRGRTLLFFSDTHYGTLNGPGMAEKLVRDVEKLKPDMIISGGDLFDGPRGKYDSTLAVLSRLKAPLGVLAVLGNHDYFYLSRPGSSKDLLRRQRNREVMELGPGTRWATVRSALPWRFLENESMEIDGVVFAGLRPFSRPDEAAALELLSGLDGSEPTVLINHKPNHVEEAAAAGVKLQLSGHTHGGPVFPVNIIMRHLLKGRHHGTSKVGGMVLDVSSGSGISLWYPRTAGRHELVVVEFSAADSRR
ncbi:MAG: metallophosphoesterase [Spirochaetaceae bacterium]|nr:metallophosphoesterase [Spirochaetaceae bacterium]